MGEKLDKIHKIITDSDYRREWLTGRSAKEADVYANFDSVETVTNRLNTLATNTVPEAETEVVNKIKALNNVKGVADYVGTLSTDAISFDAIGTEIKSLASLIQGKADAIKEYSESSWLDKGFSTLFMATSKFGEGVLSVGEDLIDGAAGIVGKVSTNKKFEKKLEKFVEKNWSHDAFNFYYNSDLAKKSTITEDSAIAGGIKIAGTVTGYLYAGGVVSGGITGSTTIGKGMLKVASSSTWGQTAAAGLGGLGSGTEAGIASGKDINKAFTSEGLKQGVKQAGLAFAGGKLGEKLAKNANVREAKKTLDKADDLFNDAKATKNALKDAGKTNGNDWVKANRELNSAEKSLTTAEKELAAAKNTKLSSYQGYTDSVSKAGQRFGQSGKNLGKSTVDYGKNVINTTKANRLAKSADNSLKEATAAKNALKNAGKTTGNDWVVAGRTENAAEVASKSARAEAEAAKAELSSSKQTLNNAVQDIKTNNPISSGVKTVKSAEAKAVNAVKNTPSTIKNGAQKGAQSIKNTSSNVKQNVSEYRSARADVSSAKKTLNQADKTLKAATDTKNALKDAGKTTGNDWVVAGRTENLAESVRANAKTGLEDASLKYATKKDALIREFKEGINTLGTKAADKTSGLIQTVKNNPELAGVVATTGYGITNAFTDAKVSAMANQPNIGTNLELEIPSSDAVVANPTTSPIISGPGNGGGGSRSGSGSGSGHSSAASYNNESNEKSSNKEKTEETKIETNDNINETAKEIDESQLVENPIEGTAPEEKNINQKETILEGDSEMANESSKAVESENNRETEYVNLVDNTTKASTTQPTSTIANTKENTTYVNGVSTNTTRKTYNTSGAVSSQPRYSEETPTNIVEQPKDENEPHNLELEDSTPKEKIKEEPIPNPQHTKYYENLDSNSLSTQTKQSSSGSGNSAVPIVSGVAAAAAAGIGTKMYLDKKEKSYEESEPEEYTNEVYVEDNSEVEGYESLNPEEDNLLSNEIDENMQTEAYNSIPNEDLENLY